MISPRLFGLVLASVALTAVKGCFALSPQANINRTAVFMLIFLVVHMLGNLSAFAGADAFNTYGHMLNQNPALKFIEYYLLLVAVLHVLVGTYLTFKKKNMTINKGFFLFTGFVLLAFICSHLYTFKFGPDYRTKEGVRDLFKLEQEVFSDPKQVAWYVVPLSRRALLVAATHPHPSSSCRSRPLSLSLRAHLWPAAGMCCRAACYRGTSGVAGKLRSGGWIFSRRTRRRARLVGQLGTS